MLVGPLLEPWMIRGPKFTARLAGEAEQFAGGTLHILSRTLSKLLQLAQ